MAHVTNIWIKFVEIFIHEAHLSNILGKVLKTSCLAYGEEREIGLCFVGVITNVL